MKVQNHGSSEIEVTLEGFLQQTTPLFKLDFSGCKQLRLRMRDVLVINSSGVKEWILWSQRLPKDCIVQLFECPMTVVSQASGMVGFSFPNMTIESIQLPYACDSCGDEDFHLVVRGPDYNYATPNSPSHVTLPSSLRCSNCGAASLEPDIIFGTAFKFLK